MEERRYLHIAKWDIHSLHAETLCGIFTSRLVSVHSATCPACLEIQSRMKMHRKPKRKRS